MDNHSGALFQDEDDLVDEIIISSSDDEIGSGDNERQPKKSKVVLLKPQAFAAKLIERGCEMVTANKAESFSKGEMTAIRQELNDMTTAIKKHVTTAGPSLQSKMMFIADGKLRTKLFEAFYHDKTIRNGYKILVDLLLQIVDCFAYLDIELFGKGEGMTKAIQVLLQIFCLDEKEGTVCRQSAQTMSNGTLSENDVAILETMVKDLMNPEIASKGGYNLDKVLPGLCHHLNHLEEEKFTPVSDFLSKDSSHAVRAILAMFMMVAMDIEHLEYTSDIELLPFLTLLRDDKNDKKDVWADALYCIGVCIVGWQDQKCIRELFDTGKVLHNRKHFANIMLQKKNKVMNPGLARMVQFGSLFFLCQQVFERFLTKTTELRNKASNEPHFEDKVALKLITQLEELTTVLLGVNTPTGKNLHGRRAFFSQQLYTIQLIPQLFWTSNRFPNSLRVRHLDYFRLDTMRKLETTDAEIRGLKAALKVVMDRLHRVENAAAVISGTEKAQAIVAKSNTDSPKSVEQEPQYSPSPSHTPEREEAKASKDDDKEAGLDSKPAAVVANAGLMTNQDKEAGLDSKPAAVMADANDKSEKEGGPEAEQNIPAVPKVTDAKSTAPVVTTATATSTIATAAVGIEKSEMKVETTKQAPESLPPDMKLRASFVSIATARSNVAAAAAGTMIGEKKTTHRKIPLTLTVEESSEAETSSDGSVFSPTEGNPTSKKRRRGSKVNPPKKKRKKVKAEPTTESKTTHNPYGTTKY